LRANEQWAEKGLKVRRFLKKKERKKEKLIPKKLAAFGRKMIAESWKRRNKEMRDYKEQKFVIMVGS